MTPERSGKEENLVRRSAGRDRRTHICDQTRLVITKLSNIPAAIPVEDTTSSNYAECRWRSGRGTQQERKFFQGRGKAGK